MIRRQEPTFLQGLRHLRFTHGATIDLTEPDTTSLASEPHPLPVSFGTKPLRSWAEILSMDPIERAGSRTTIMSWQAHSESSESAPEPFRRRYCTWRHNARSETSRDVYPSRVVSL